MTDAAKKKPVLDLYARVSQKGDARRRSMGGQTEANRRRAEELGATVGEVFDKDDGRSAWNPRVKRHDWDRLMQRLESGASDGVVVFDLARFSRRPSEGERLIEAADRGLLIADSESTYDLTTGTGRKAFRDSMSAAAFYSDEISARTKRGKAEKAKAGETNHSRRPFGFEPDGSTIRESEAKEIAEATQRLLKGESVESLVADWNRRGVKTSLDAQWTGRTLKYVLTRSRNMGGVEHLGVIVGKLPGKPIVDPEDFERLMSMFAARRRGRPASDKYLCSGIALCGKCGNRLTGRPRSGVGADGEQKREYLCVKRQGRGGCWGVVADGGGLDNWAKRFTIARMTDPANLERVRARTAEAESVAAEASELESQIAEAEQLAAALADRLGRGELSLARYDAAIKPLDARIGSLSARRQELPQHDPALLAILSDGEAEQLWANGTPARRRVMLQDALAGAALVVNPAGLSAPPVFDNSRVAVVPQGTSS